MLLLTCTPSLVMGATLTFDDLPNLPGTASVANFIDANGGSAVYGGVTFDSQFRVVGDAFRIDTTTPGPVYGIPVSGHYFVTNVSAGSLNGVDGVVLTTDQVLTGSWWGRNEYYGFGTGADQITINALHGASVLQALTFDLPAPLVNGQPGQPAFFDTSAFSSLTGITGYRIDRREGSPLNGNWVADNLTFTGTSSPVPEPSSMCLLALGLIGGGGSFLRRRQLAAATPSA
jgi:hypothetical protein